MHLTAKPQHAAVLLPDFHVHSSMVVKTMVVRINGIKWNLMRTMTMTTMMTMKQTKMKEMEQTMKIKLYILM